MWPFEAFSSVSLLEIGAGLHAPQAPGHHSQRFLSGSLVEMLREWTLCTPPHFGEGETKPSKISWHPHGVGGPKRSHTSLDREQAKLD